MLAKLKVLPNLFPEVILLDINRKPKVIENVQSLVTFDSFVAHNQ